MLKRNIGLNYTDGHAAIKLWAPLAERVALIKGDGEHELTKGEHGYWHLNMEMRPGDTYAFSLDGGKPLPDPASLLQADGVHGWSTVVDLDHDQSDQNYHHVPLSDYIIYELHTGTFSAAGNFEGIEQRLDHLVDLGITAIELMPVAEFPGDRNWGYDGVFPFAVHHSFGGPKGLQKLIDACHRKGLAVILDVVYNHVGPEGNYLGSFGPYFTDKYRTPWGNAINFDHAWCDGVREYFIENTLMWFRDFHIDALRMDAVHAIKDLSPKHILQEIREQVDELMKETGRTHYLIVECDLNDTRFLRPIGEAGLGMDAQWTDEFHHALRVTAGQKRDGYYADFYGINDLAKAYANAYVYDGQYSEERHKRFGVKADGRPGQQFIVFSQNHDQVGNRMLGERTSTLHDPDMQKLLAAAVMISPYLPMLFMGEEYAEPNPFLYFVSHTEPELIEAVRNGRKDEFKAFHAEGEAPDPQAEETYLNSKLQWNILDQEPHHTMLNYYKELIALRKSEPLLRSPDRNNLEVEVDPEQDTLILRRWTETRELTCLLNFSDLERPLEAREGYTKIFDSSGSADEQALLKPRSIIIYAK